MATAATQADVSYRISPASNEPPWCVKSGQEAAIKISSCGNIMGWTPHAHYLYCDL